MSHEFLHKSYEHERISKKSETYIKIKNCCQSLQNIFNQVKDRAKQK